MRVHAEGAAVDQLAVQLHLVGVLQECLHGDWWGVEVKVPQSEEETDSKGSSLGKGGEEDKHISSYRLAASEGGKG